MIPVHLLSSDSRPTNTQWHWSHLTWNNSATLQTHWTSSNAASIMELRENGWLAFAPYYNVLGKSVKDTMEAIAENYTILQLHSITRMQIEYVLAMRKWVEPHEVTEVYSHLQALVQTTEVRKTTIPDAKPKSTNTTAAWLEFILRAENAWKPIAAVTTPFQILSGEWEQLTVHENFWPNNNNTYFALLWLKDADVRIPHLINSPNHEVMSEEVIRFWVLTIPDYPGSLCDALWKIAEHGINIMSIMSFPQSDGTVIFTIAYKSEQLPSDNSLIRINEKKPVIDQMQSIDNAQFSARIHIPNNSTGSLHRTLNSLKEAINLQEITSIGTWVDTVDFDIKFSLLSISTDDIGNKLNKLLLDSSSTPNIIHPTTEEIRTILHNLH